MKTPLNDMQVRAARELLRWDQKKLALEAGLGIATIRRYETGQHVGEDTTADLVAAFERAGVLFIGETSFNGVVVSSAVALRAWARPEPRPPTRIYGEPKQIKRTGGSKRTAKARKSPPNEGKAVARTKAAGTGAARPRKRAKPVPKG